MNTDLPLAPSMCVGALRCATQVVHGRFGACEGGIWAQARHVGRADVKTAEECGSERMRMFTSWGSASLEAAVNSKDERSDRNGMMAHYGVSVTQGSRLRKCVRSALHGVLGDMELPPSRRSSTSCSKIRGGCRPPPSGPHNRASWTGKMGCATCPEKNSKENSPGPRS